MRQVSDGFLLNMAEVSGALVGLFLVGVFFFVETGLGQLGSSREVVAPYFRAGTRIVLVLFAMSLLLSLTLVVLEPVWSTVLFAVLSVMLIAANLDTAIRIRAVGRITRSTPLVVNEMVGTVAVLVIVVLPWALGGLHPTREDLTWAILLSFAAAFLSVCALVLAAFDISRFEATARTQVEGTSSV
ncbi:MAG: hypothetical protein L0206_01555 [Actinobacteria bacterium]|nr:hypothetical protein [Actinomycetota bacterium]